MQMQCFCPSYIKSRSRLQRLSNLLFFFRIAFQICFWDVAYALERLWALQAVNSLKPWVAQNFHPPSLNQYTKLNHYTQRDASPTHSQSSLNQYTKLNHYTQRDASPTHSQPSLNQYTKLNHYTQQSERDAVAWAYDSEVSSGLV